MSFDADTSVLNVHNQALRSDSVRSFDRDCAFARELESIFNQVD